MEVLHITFLNQFVVLQIMKFVLQI